MWYHKYTYEAVVVMLLYIWQVKVGHTAFCHKCIIHNEYPLHAGTKTSLLSPAYNIDETVIFFINNRCLLLRHSVDEILHCCSLKSHYFCMWLNCFLNRFSNTHDPGFLQSV